MRREIDLHHADHCVQSSLQRDKGLEDRVRERKLEERATVSGFGGCEVEQKIGANRGFRSWRLSTPLVLPVAGL